MVADVPQIIGNLALKNRVEVERREAVSAAGEAEEDFAADDVNLKSVSVKRVAHTRGKARYNHLRVLDYNGVKAKSDAFRIVRPDRPRLAANIALAKRSERIKETYSRTICREKAQPSYYLFKKVLRRKDIIFNTASFFSGKQTAGSVFVYQGLRNFNSNLLRRKLHLLQRIFCEVGSVRVKTSIFTSFVEKVFFALLFLALLFLAFGFGVSLVNTFDSLEAGKTIAASSLPARF